ncbi:MAG: 30S ribosomal protein S12 methylthiotransferase RimO [Sulfuritalea sp.]|nr:30S ribosomal protein S12 methylthiotransferase RimO [Sulfuritalea sp.]
MATRRKTRAPTVGFVSLGCPKAASDAEQILTRLRAEGYEISGSYDGADLVVVNTCGFIDAAVEESLDAIGEALAENGKVIVTGCLGAKKDAAGNDIVRAAHPKVLAVTGPHAMPEVMEAVHRHLPPLHDPFVDLVPPQGIRLTPDHYAYLKISEGCNHRCTFCIIPSLRGDLVSRPIGEVMREAEALAQAGVREILVISQDTSAYGVDVKYRTGFWGGKPVKTRLFELCSELAKLGIWVRLHYVYPYPSVDDLIPLMAERKILPYLDVPFQHASQRILKLMKRPASAEKVLDRIAAWRREVPDLTIRSTFITGFPGETEAEFNELLDFLDEAQLDRVGAFAYSPVEGATANQLPGALPEGLREERKARLLRHQEDISTQRLERRIGRRITVLVDDVDEEGAIARSAGDAPDIDGLVYVTDGHDLEIGDFAEVNVIDCDVHDLYATLAACE